MRRPVEAGAQIVDEPLAGVLGADFAREVACLLQIGCLCFKPEQVRVGRERHGALDRSLTNDKKT